MGTTSPLSADDDLFAVKGHAVPLDKERPPPASPDAVKQTPVGDTAPLPGIFTEDDYDAPADPPGPDDAEPPPAASLLSIAAQESAARSRKAMRGPSRPGSDSVTEPDISAEDASPDSVDQIDPSETAPQIYLPVPVSKNLPSVIAPPAAKSPRRYAKPAFIAASIALLIVGAIAILDEQAGPDPQVADVGPTAPPEIEPAAIVATPAPDPQKSEIVSVRFERPGQAIVSGRAAPRTELIVLRDRQPLGTTRSNDTGEWTLSARVPTRTERHEISVVPMQIDTSLTVDQPSFVPRPQRRPAVPPAATGAPTRTYFAQIASLPSATDAAQEARKLTAKLSGAVAADRISVRAGRIEQGRTVYRVAIDGFTTKVGAATACARILALNTPCLVMCAP